MNSDHGTLGVGDLTDLKGLQDACHCSHHILPASTVMTTSTTPEESQ